MTEMVEVGGASLAWRLLATLEGGSLLLATSALLAYSARKRVARLKRNRPVRSVLLTNASNMLGKDLKTRLESRGCVVHTLSEDITSQASSGLSEARTSGAIVVDALVVVGAVSSPKEAGLQRMAKLVSEDVYSNLKLLETLSRLVHRGGRLAWACTGAATNASSWEGAGDAFDTVLQANLHRVAKVSHCEAVWVGRCSDSGQAAEKLVDALLINTTPYAFRFSIRNAAHKIGEYVGRWLKIVT